MSKCVLCQEKQVEIDRILAAYAKDKKLYHKVMGALSILLLFVTAFGTNGLTYLLDFAKDMVK
jgi:hypothetical protein